MWKVLSCLLRSIKKGGVVPRELCHMKCIIFILTVEVLKNLHQHVLTIRPLLCPLLVLKFLKRSLKILVLLQMVTVAIEIIINIRTGVLIF